MATTRKPAKVKKYNETDLVHEIINYLNESGRVLAFRNNTGAIKKGPRFIRYGLGTGSPDIVGILEDGAFLALEIKLPGKGKKSEPSEEQAAWLTQAHDHGAVAFCATSLKQVMDILSGMNYL